MTSSEIKHRLGGGTYLVEEPGTWSISHFKLNNEADSGGIYACPANLYAAGRRLQEIARDKGFNPFPKEPVSPQPEVTSVDAVVESKTKSPPRYVNLTDQAKTIFRHIMRAGSISAREAMNDYGITSATLARRICDLEKEGYKIERVSKVHPITYRKYTRYSFPRGTS